MKLFLAASDRTPLLVCMSISLVMWLVSALSESYTTSQIPVEVLYRNLPDNKLPSQPLPQQLHLTIETNGIQIIKQYWQKIRLTIDYANYIPAKILATQQLMPLLMPQLPNSKILNVSPDTIFFKFERIAQKKIPVFSDSDAKPAKRFDIKEIILQPDSVIVSGPASVLDTIKHWKTQKLVLRDLSQDFEGEVPLVLPEISTLSLNTNNIMYTIKVEEFTEKKLLDIPIEIKNLPKGMSVFLYPSTVTLQFQVGISEFEYIKQSNFTIVADFIDIDFTKDKLIRLSVAQQPLTIKGLSILPQNSVEFIVINRK